MQYPQHLNSVYSSTPAKFNVVMGNPKLVDVGGTMATASVQQTEPGLWRTEQRGRGTARVKSLRIESCGFFPPSLALVLYHLNQNNNRKQRRSRNDVVV